MNAANTNLSREARWSKICKLLHRPAVWGQIASKKLLDSPEMHGHFFFQRSIYRIVNNANFIMKFAHFGVPRHRCLVTILVGSTPHWSTTRQDAFAWKLVHSPSPMPGR